MAQSLIEVAKKKIINDMVREVCPKTNDGWKILIVDQQSLRIISSCCTMTEITDEKVTVVEKIENPREKVPNEAIYFLTPTPKSIDLLINDFKKKAHYPAIHLFLTSKLPDAEFKKLAASNAVQKVRTMKELNLEYLSWETQVFHLDMQHTLETYFAKNAMENIDEQSKIATKLVSFCATMNECPIIRYSRSNPISTVVASLTQEKMDQVLRATKFNYNDDRSTLLILDRSQDPLAPLLHEFSYQAMVYDLFDIKNDIYHYDSVTNNGVIKKDVLLSENDYLWSQLRHKHIADVSESLQTRLDDFLKTNQVTQYQNSDGHTRSLQEARDVVRSLPQYQEIMSKYSTHINLTEQAFAKVTDDLTQIATLEQDMATGSDKDGGSPKNIIGRLSNFMTSGMDETDKLRLLMSYVITQEGIKDQDRKKLMDLGSFGADQQAAIYNLFHLGVTMMKGASNKKQKQQINKNRKADSVGYELSRYVPVVKDIVESLVLGQLADADFPYLREAPITQQTASATSNVSLRGKANQPRWAEPMTKVEETKYTGSKLIIFVIGGVTLSEIRSIYELSQYYKKNIYIGSTGILYPKDYVYDVQKIQRPDSQMPTNM